MKRVVIFGAGKVGEVVGYYFRHESDFELAGFTCDREYAPGDSFLDLPFHSFDEVEQHFPPAEFAIFVALGYQRLNRFRAETLERVRAKGYQVVSYIHPQAHVPKDFRHGENCLVLDNQAVQPRARIGNNVFVWSGSLLGHHSVIQDHCWITSSAAISGSVVLGRNCFVGTNATVAHEVEIGEYSVLGAGCLVTHSQPAGSVIVQPETARHRLNSDQFLKLTKLF